MILRITARPSKVQKTRWLNSTNKDIKAFWCWHFLFVCWSCVKNAILNSSHMIFIHILYIYVNTHVLCIDRRTQKKYLLWILSVCIWCFIFIIENDSYLEWTCNGFYLCHFLHRPLWRHELFSLFFFCPSEPKNISKSIACVLCALRDMVTDYIIHYNSAKTKPKIHSNIVQWLK